MMLLMGRDINMRTETTTRTLYKYDELPTDTAKERAREWFNAGQFDYDWWDFVYKDAANIGLKIDAFDCYRGNISGELQDTVNGIVARIRKEHGKSCGTYKLALTIDRRKRNDDEDTLHEFRYALLKEYLTMLRSEIEYMESTEQIEDNIRANEYEFTENGEVA
jgi:hypothetical protein